MIDFERSHRPGAIGPSGALAFSRVEVPLHSAVRLELGDAAEGRRAARVAILDPTDLGGYEFVIGVQ